MRRPIVMTGKPGMLQLFGKKAVLPSSHLGSHLGPHRGASVTTLSGWSALLCTLSLVAACKAHAQPPETDAEGAETHRCLPTGDGFLRARITGTLTAELDWGNEGLECTGAVRPTDGGIRMRFAHAAEPGGGRLVLVFGIAELREGQNARAVPVNVTVMREGTGEFYSTQGDDKCTLDRVTQEAIAGIPRRERSYRVVARGFCTEPARAVNGPGALLLSRFDYAGRVDFDAEEDSDTLMARAQSFPSLILSHRAP